MRGAATHATVSAQVTPAAPLQDAPPSSPLSPECARWGAFYPRGVVVRFLAGVALGVVFVISVYVSLLMPAAREYELVRVLFWIGCITYLTMFILGSETDE